MTRPTIQNGNDIREMNDTEHAQYLIDVKVAATTSTATAAAQAATVAAKLSAQTKLAALGLTADEIAAL